MRRAVIPSAILNLLLASCARAPQPGPPLDVAFTVPGEFAPRSLSDFRGRVVALTVWLPGCPPCDIQAAILNALAQQYSREGLVCFVLSAPAQPVTLGNLSILTGTLDASQLSLLPKERPATLILDREGRVSARFTASAEREELEKILEPLLGR